MLAKFSQKLIDSGYDGSSREEILRSVIGKYHGDIARTEKEGASIYHSRVEMTKAREVKNLLNKPWFRQKMGE